MSQLPTAILTSTQRIEALVATASAALKHSKLLPADLSREVTNASLSITMINTECRELRTVMAAARMCGQADAVTTAESLELHPANLAPQVPDERLLASLHRAGDHTQDPENERGDG